MKNSKEKSTQNKREKENHPSRAMLLLTGFFHFFFSLLTSCSYSSSPSSSLSSLFSQKRGNSGYLDESAALRYAQCLMPMPMPPFQVIIQYATFCVHNIASMYSTCTVTAQHTHTIFLSSPPIPTPRPLIIHIQPLALPHSIPPHHDRHSTTRSTTNRTHDAIARAENGEIE